MDVSIRTAYELDHLLTKWHPEDDPLTQEQADVLISLVGNEITEKAMEGFLIVCSRFIDEFGHHRTHELENIFRTQHPEGKKALVNSLEYINQWVGGMGSYIDSYPVTIIPPKPAFPQFKIIGIETLVTRIYRILDSSSTAYPTDELIQNYVQRTGRLPAVPIQKRPVRRSKPRFHWCSYGSWDNPETTRDMLQILPQWSDCQLRASLLTSHIKRSAYVAFNGDKYDPDDNSLGFYKYYYEPLAQDNPELCGGGTQIAVQGAPRVEQLERWSQTRGEWELIWHCDP